MTKKHFSEEGQSVRFIDASITTSIRNQIDNPSKRPEVVKKILIKRGSYKGRNNPMFGKHHSKKTKRELHLKFWKESSNHKTYYKQVARRVAEKKLGRELLPGESVHHLDHDRTNNHPDNLHVFKSISNHTKYHRLKEQWIIEELKKSGVINHVGRFGRFSLCRLN